MFHPFQCCNYRCTQSQKAQTSWFLLYIFSILIHYHSTYMVSDDNLVQYFSSKRQEICFLSVISGYSFWFCGWPYSLGLFIDVDVFNIIHNESPQYSRIKSIMNAVCSYNYNFKCFLCFCPILYFFLLFQIVYVICFMIDPVFLYIIIFHFLFSFLDCFHLSLAFKLSHFFLIPVQPKDPQYATFLSHCFFYKHSHLTLSFCL